LKYNNEEKLFNHRDRHGHRYSSGPCRDTPHQVLFERKSGFEGTQWEKRGNQGAAFDAQLQEFYGWHLLTSIKNKYVQKV
tara:strand:+ start:1840 stop:2079 length:240 start_codon:yes stop_codon:yes gene_type:complete